MFSLLLIFTLAMSCIARAEQHIWRDDVLVFGAYEQDGDFYNGSESIYWIITDIDEFSRTFTVVSMYLLDCTQYHSSTRTTSWANTDLNRWLQSEFVPSAFSGAERSYIRSVSIPSERDIRRYFTDYRCRPTQYAIQRGVYHYENGGKITGSYWLRLNQSSKWGVFVGVQGGIYDHGNQVTVTDNGVRVMMTLSLDLDWDSVQIYP